MKDWMKQNLVLVIGLTLPLLLIVLFFVATVIPKAFGTPPQYEMLFSATQYDYQRTSEFTLNFNVKNRQLMVKPKKVEDKNANYNQVRLFVYDGKTETTRELAFDKSKFTDGVEVVLEETKSFEIDTGNVSPDGYALDGPSYRGGGMMMGMFGGGYHNSGYRIKKGGVAYKVPYYKGDAYYNQMQFIGWVVKN
ncbi:MAG: hypothetical protein CVU29_06585 [Betaproteobacteria bacterium HGW-Betaproteobacteria-22]|nr:MAG: hypothetical protein CVU29_06585 [Betaproteobacteria bacterium HGW-Betaproteobacteria-22]